MPNVTWGNFNKIPACTIKFTPFARLALSSAAPSPAAALGLCSTSQSSKSHWSGRRGEVMAGGEGAAGGMRGREKEGRRAGMGAGGGDGVGMEG